MWKQPWTAEAKSTLAEALENIGSSINELDSQEWDPKTLTIGGVRDYMTSYLAPASASWSSVTLHLYSLAAELLGAELSRMIGGPAIAFFEFEQAVWGYILFDRGDLLDKFWNKPEIVELPGEQCLGNAEILSRIFAVQRESIAPYLKQGRNLSGKAFPDDKRTLDDHWVRVDFMRRLGLQYPNPGEVAGGVHVEIDEPIQ